MLLSNNILNSFIFSKNVDGRFILFEGKELYPTHFFLCSSSFSISLVYSYPSQCSSLSSLLINIKEHTVLVIFSQFSTTYFPCSGNSTSAILDGVALLTLLPRGEDYTITIPYAHCKGILMGTLTMEYGGKVTLDCEKTGYRTEIEFKLKVC